MPSKEEMMRTDMKQKEQKDKSRGIWGGKVTRQLNAEDEAGMRTTLRILAWGTGLVL